MDEMYGTIMTLVEAITVAMGAFAIIGGFWSLVQFSRIKKHLSGVVIANIVSTIAACFVVVFFSLSQHFDFLKFISPDAKIFIRFGCMSVSFVGAWKTANFILAVRSQGKDE